MSAVEALAEVLREHLGGTCSICDDDQPSHLAADLAAAIRSMPAELKAEVIDGTVESADEQTGIDEDEVIYYRATEGGPWLPKTRVVTPWLPLGVSPETNGEQK